MKNHISIYLLLIALLSACTVNDHVIGQHDENEGDVFYAIIEDESTRVFVDSALHVLWNADDHISIFNRNTYNQEYIFTGEDGDNSGSFNKVEHEEFVTGNPIESVYSIYPYQKSTKISYDGVISTSLPAEQFYKAYSFGNGANTMVSVSEDNYLQFKNVCGYLRVSLFGEGISVSSITLIGNDGERISGKASISMQFGGVPSVIMDNSASTEITMTCEPPVELWPTINESTDFWFVVPPVTFAKGFTIIVKGTDGRIFKKSTTKSILIDRNQLYKMSRVELRDNEITSITINSKYIYLQEGESKNLSTTVIPDNASDRIAIWKSSNPSVVDVDSDGTLKAIQEGGVYITATLGDLIDTCWVAVNLLKSQIRIDDFQITEGDDNIIIELQRLYSTHGGRWAYYNISEYFIKWSSSNTNIVRVYPAKGGSLGEVFGISPGTATITVKMMDMVASCQVTVNKKQ